MPCTEHGCYFIDGAGEAEVFSVTAFGQSQSYLHCFSAGSLSVLDALAGLLYAAIDASVEVSAFDSPAVGIAEAFWQAVSVCGGEEAARAKLGIQFTLEVDVGERAIPIDVICMAGCGYGSLVRLAVYLDGKVVAGHGIAPF